MLIDQIMNSFVSVFKTNPVIMLIILVFLGIFLWLSKEIRLQLDKERAFQQNEIKTSLDVLSRILLEGEKYKLNKDENNFFEAIYSAIPFIDYKLAEEILVDTSQETITEEEKVLKIIKLVREKILQHSLRNKVYSNSKYLFEDVEKVFVRFWRIFEPSVFSFCIIFFFLCLWMISLPWESHFWIVMKPASLIISFMLLIFTIDLIMERKGINTPVTLLGLSSVLAFITVITFEKYSWIPLSLFLVMFAAAFYIGVRDKKNATINTELNREELSENVSNT